MEFATKTSSLEKCSQSNCSCEHCGLWLFAPYQSQCKTHTDTEAMPVKNGDVPNPSLLMSPLQILFLHAFYKSKQQQWGINNIVALVPNGFENVLSLSPNKVL